MLSKFINKIAFALAGVMLATGFMPVLTMAQNALHIPNVLFAYNDYSLPLLELEKLKLPDEIEQGWKNSSFDIADNNYLLLSNNPIFKKPNIMLILKIGSEIVPVASKDWLLVRGANVNFAKTAALRLDFGNVSISKLAKADLEVYDDNNKRLAVYRKAFTFPQYASYWTCNKANVCNKTVTHRIYEAVVLKSKPITISLGTIATSARNPNIWMHNPNLAGLVFVKLVLKDQDKKVVGETDWVVNAAELPIEQFLLDFSGFKEVYALEAVIEPFPNQPDLSIRLYTEYRQPGVIRRFFDNIF